MVSKAVKGHKQMSANPGIASKIKMVMQLRDALRKRRMAQAAVQQAQAPVQPAAPMGGSQEMM
jgi:hypothetical protein